MGVVCSKVKDVTPPSGPPLRLLPLLTALISAVAHSGVVTAASYVNLAEGVSAHGMRARGSDLSGRCRGSRQ